MPTAGRCTRQRWVQLRNRRHLCSLLSPRPRGRPTKRDKCPLLPNEPRGVSRVDDRRVLNGIFWVLRPKERPRFRANASRRLAGRPSCFAAFRDPHSQHRTLRICRSPIQGCCNIARAARTQISCNPCYPIRSKSGSASEAGKLVLYNIFTFGPEIRSRRRPLGPRIVLQT
jgi:transposase